jgi:hypothetical protein
MKAKISKYLLELGFKKTILPMYIMFTYGTKKECIVMPKGKLMQSHVMAIKRHLVDNGWLCANDFDKCFINTVDNRIPRALESIALTALKAGQVFYTHKKDKDITAIAGYYKRKVKTERLFVIDPQSGDTQKVVRVTLL